jgi:hypothetical protein
MSFLKALFDGPAPDEVRLFIIAEKRFANGISITVTIPSNTALEDLAARQEAAKVIIFHLQILRNIKIHQQEEADKLTLDHYSLVGGIEVEITAPDSISVRQKEEAEIQCSITYNDLLPRYRKSFVRISAGVPTM